MKIDINTKGLGELKISDFSYNLPDERIAKYPLPERDQSKLMLYKDGEVEDLRFYNLESLIPSNSLMLFNNTRVIHARLYFQKPTGATIEIFCLTPFSPEEYQENFNQRERVVWSCMVGNARRWKDDVLRMDVDLGCERLVLSAKKVEQKGGEFLVEFSWDNPRWTFAELLEELGELPIPPYLNRDTEVDDDVTYQTVYSSTDGSVAAPTAGLHFMPRTFETLRKKGVRCEHLTLHVGAGTFRPVKDAQIVKYSMHTEYISFAIETIEALLAHSGPVITVGTTSLRAVESLYFIGVKIKENPDLTLSSLKVTQWEPYEKDIEVTRQEALEAVLTYMRKMNIKEIFAETQIMIVPGYDFRFPDALITNFHQPESTLLLLMAAFAGEDWKSIYRFALDNDYRFLSYGDSSLIWRKNKS